MLRKDVFVAVSAEDDVIKWIIEEFYSDYNILPVSAKCLLERKYMIIN